MAINIADLEAKILLHVQGGDEAVRNLRLISSAAEEAKKWQETALPPVRTPLSAASYRNFATEVEKMSDAFLRAYKQAELFGTEDRKLQAMTAKFAEGVAAASSKLGILNQAIEKARGQFAGLPSGMDPVSREMLLLARAFELLDNTVTRRTGGFKKLIPGRGERDEIRDFTGIFNKMAQQYEQGVNRMLTADAKMASSGGGALARISGALGGGRGGIASVDPQLTNHLNQVSQLLQQLAAYQKQLNDMNQRAIDTSKRLAEAEAARASAQERANRIAREAAEAMKAQSFATNANAQAKGANAAAAAAEATAFQRLLDSLRQARTAGDAWKGLNGHLSEALFTLGQFAPMASGPLGSFLGRLASFSFVTQGGLGLAATVGGLSLATLGMKRFFDEAVRVEKILGPVRELHLALAKTVGEDGTKNFETLTGVMVKYGLSLEALSKPIARLKLATDGTILGGDRFKSFLEDFAAIGSKFALPQEAMSGMAKAFEQMISKGTVQAEEFRQQLGDRLPAAARVGLETFRVMTGNANASFKDFMDAMKNRQIESTRFLDIFMIKLKEMFNINNEATNNLASAYGRLSTSRDLAISKLDQSIGLTRAWMQVLNGLSAAFGGIADSATIVGPVLQLALGAGALAMVTKLGAGLALFAGTAGLVAKSVMAVRVAMVAMGAAGAYAFGSQLYDNARKFGEQLGFIEKKSIEAVQGGLIRETFKIKGELTDDQGRPLFKDPNVLIAEVSRYLTQVNEGLRQGKKIVVDFDFASTIDKAISDIRKKTEQTSEFVPTFFQNGKFKEYTRVYKEQMEGVISLDEVLTARLNKQASEGLNQRILAEKTVWDRAELAAQLRSAAMASRDIKANRESIARLEQLKQKFLDVQSELQRRSEVAIKAPSISGWDTIYGILKGMAPLLTNVASIMGIIAAVNLVGVATGLGAIGTAAATLGGRLTSVHSKLLAIGIAAAALTLFSNSSRAASASTEELSKRAVDVAQELKRAGDNFGDFGRLNEVVTDAKGRMEALKQQTAQLRLELDASRGSLADRFMRPEDRAMLPEVTRRLRDLVGIRPSRDIEIQIRANEEAMKKLQSVLDSLGPAQQKFADGTRDAARALEEEVRAATSLPDKLKEVQTAIDEANIKLAILRNGGLGALQSTEGFDALLKKYGDGIRDISAAAQAANPELAAFVAKLKELQGKETELANARKAAESERKKASTLTGGGELSKAEGIIQRAEAIIEGAGISTGNNIRKMIKDLRDYQEALVATGMTNEEAAKKVEQFRTALEMQAAGINLASLQLKPLQAMQKGMESFADTLAGLLVDGKLNSKSFADAFKQMAASIIKDIIAMTIKANIVRPLLMGLFGGGGGGFFGAGGLLGTQPVAFAKGGIVDDPVMFGFGGGKTGLMGEAGAEAIMPLRRGPDGSLGVAMHDAGGGGQAVNITFNVTSPDAGSFMKSEAQIASMLSRVASRGSRNG